LFAALAFAVFCFATSASLRTIVGLTNTKPDRQIPGQSLEEIEMLSSLLQLSRRGLSRQRDAFILMTTLTALSSWLVFWFGE
jgi:hypothetical protein